MSDEEQTNRDTVFSRRWVLPEDELLRMLWRCHGGENPDVVLVELHARHRPEHRRRTASAGGRTSRTSRHFRRGGQHLGK